jgi:glycosyltransferase involved in cell wall biosynthesis
VADPGRVAFVCDLHAEYAVGGAQRYYATLSRELARGGPTSYLTRRYWPGPASRDEHGVEVVGLTRRIDPQAGGRGIAPKLSFALALLWHLLRKGGRYEVVHCCCFPHVALIAARLGVLPHRRTTLVADWHEVLPRSTWRRRLGRIGDLGWIAQRAAIGAGRAAISFSRMHEARLRAEGRRRGVHRLPEFPTEPVRDPGAAAGGPRGRRIVFAGRLVREKRPHLVPAVLAELRHEDPAWDAVLFGTGPERARVEAEAERCGVRHAVRLAGFADWSEVSAAMGSASALVLPTEREGFGLVVLEAASHGLPSVLVAEEDNAAVELVEDGRNGRVCATADPAELARAVLALAADAGIHRSTRGWYEERRDVYSVERCAAQLRALHRALSDARGA